MISTSSSSIQFKVEWKVMKKKNCYRLSLPLFLIAMSHKKDEGDQEQKFASQRKNA